jgi:hypothetical protein
MSLKKLQEEFYAKLKADGFCDIEDITKADRPLREWHNLKFASERALQKIALRKEYQSLVDKFIGTPDFEEICQIISDASRLSENGNKLTKDEIRLIWILNTQEGQTERKIALQIGRSKTCIHLVLERLNGWMKLL